MLRTTLITATGFWLIIGIASLWLGNDPTVVGQAGVKQAEDGPGGANPSPTRASGKTIPGSGGKPIIGFALNFHYNEDRQLYLNAVDDLAALGCNTLMIPTPAYQTNAGGDEIRLEIGPGRAPFRARLIELIRKAQQRGMTTVLMPTVLFSAPRAGEWRGKIVPDSWDRWWKSYERMTDYFVDIAVEADVDIYVVGSELLTTESQRHRWQRVIRRVREKFDGAITYSGNFDAYSDPTFWDDLDLIAMNAYFDLVGDHASDHPPMDFLVERWQEHRRRVLAYARDQGKPVLFTELGFPCMPWGLKDPWDYHPYDDTKPDHAVQRDGYESFFRVWLKDLKERGDANQAFLGVCFYEWDPYREGDARDLYFGIRGKPAHDVMKRYLAEIDARR